MKPLLIVGHGQLGRALAGELGAVGVETFVWTRGEVAELERAPRASYVHGGALASAVQRAPQLLLAVPDRAVASVAGELAETLRDWTGRVALHPSGALGPGALAPLQARGADVAVCHPLRAFPRLPAGVATKLRRFAGCPFTIDGTSGAEAAAGELVAALGGVVLGSRVADRTGYHLAATVASNYGLAVRRWAARRFQAAGLRAADAELAADALARNALDNVAAARAAATTGPLLRGDVETVRAHLGGLAGDERRAYAALGLLLLDQIAALEVNGRDRTHLARLLREALESEAAAGLGTPLAAGAADV